MTLPMVGVAIGNGRAQDELCDGLARYMQAERCRTDRELLVLIARRAVAAAVVGQDLLGLDRHVLPALLRHEVPTVLLAPDREVAVRQASLERAPVRVLPFAAPPESIAGSISELLGGGSRLPRPTPTNVDLRPSSTTTTGTRGAVYAFVGPGGTGCTTVVANTLIGVGAARAVVGVDLDPVAPLLVPLLDADPSLGLEGVIRAQAAGVASLERALEANLQPLGGKLRAPRALLLGGLPLNGDRRTAPPPDLVEAALASLTAGGRIVLADVGRLLPATDRLGVLQRAVLLAADGILVVGGGDRPSILRTCDTVAQLLGTAAHPEVDRLALVINGHDATTMDAPAEIAASIGLPLAACVPNDESAMLRAVHALQPVVVVGRGPAARELFDLAEAVAAGGWPLRLAKHVPWHARLVQRCRSGLRALRAQALGRKGASRRPSPGELEAARAGVARKTRVMGARKPTFGAPGARRRAATAEQPIAAVAASVETGT